MHRAKANTRCLFILEGEAGEGLSSSEIESDLSGLAEEWLEL